MDELLAIDARSGYPGTLVSVRHAGGRLLYLEAKTSPVLIVAALEPEDVRRLRDALSGWLAGREEEPPAPAAAFTRAPLVAGAVSRGLADAAARWGQAAALSDAEAELVGPPPRTGTVQICTVVDGSDQHVSGPRRAPV